MPRNIFRKNDLHEKLIEIKLLGYLDDTTWFATNLKDLQNNLAIADDFYALANIKINKDKTKILTNDFKINKKQHILIKFGNDIVKDGAEIAFPNLQYCGFKN
uniref:Reverse transcriptase domain-containing protein n=1 Tax=Rhizophagus irregularis (strain DAOM 181602 / DAOM 197198 / MUCL 43194) TaxID=747089 RepID=U9UQ68_RHIID